MIDRQLVVVVSLLALVLSSGGAEAQESVPMARVAIGDDARWAQPDWDDSDWQERPLYEPPDTAAVLWVRHRIHIDTIQAAGLGVSAVAARDVYWDGVLVGRSGTVGTSPESEVPGPIDTLIPIPDSLAAPGEHLLAIRLSTFRRHPSIGGYIQGVWAGTLPQMVSRPLRSIALPLVFLGGFVLIALYYGVLYLSNRERTPFLLTALLCFAVAALLVTESWRAWVGYPYDLHILRLGTVTGLTCLVGFLLVAVFVAQYRVPYRRIVLGALAGGIGLALFAPGGWDYKAYAVFAISIPTALGVTAWAVRDRQPGAGWAVAGVAVCLGALLVAGLRFMDGAFFPAFGVLMAGLLASLGLQTREARRQHEATLAEAARLEAELLKKHLQPHFLMNALTSVMEWVETDPKTGNRALAALADELRALSDISQERLISMDRELALCRAHLEVMSFRREVDVSLRTEGVELAAPIPPAVIHTLVENAITHNAYASGTVELLLREEQTDAGRRLTLRAPLASSPQMPVREGGGLRYVRARLEESFPGQWSLSSGAEEEAWVTQINLPASR
ncbi:MAG: histidine kinase [Bacteroidota bacterium]